jgi:16S rRNA (guanine(527)-N(7))-methyltransferase RsmG
MFHDEHRSKMKAKTRAPGPSAAEIAAISAVLRELGLPIGVLSLLLAHSDAVEADADRLGLVSAADRGLVLARHSADSLLFALARAPEPGESWVDVGSGAGFPGLVLAIAYAGTRFTLVEPQERRAGFLDLQAANLGLANVVVAQARTADLSERFDVATARALAEPLLAIEAMRPLIVAEGTVLVAVGDHHVAPPGVEDLDCRRPGVDSPGRIFRLAEVRGEA